VGKAAGNNDLLPDIVKCCGGPLLDFVVSLFSTVWSEKQVPVEWRDATLVPVLKRRDLSECDNWRGISLLDVMGKLFARIINDGLQVVVEDSVANSQCDFRAGRGCVDLSFCVGQLVKKTIEHHRKIFLLFFDLHKAKLRMILCHGKHFGVFCGNMVCLIVWLIWCIQSFHDGMAATVAVGGAEAPPFEVRNGLCQGCTIVPTCILSKLSTSL